MDDNNSSEIILQLVTGADKEGCMICATFHGFRFIFVFLAKAQIKMKGRSGRHLLWWPDTLTSFHTASCSQVPLITSLYFLLLLCSMNIMLYILHRYPNTNANWVSKVGCDSSDDSYQVNFERLLLNTHTSFIAVCLYVYISTYLPISAVTRQTLHLHITASLL